MNGEHPHKKLEAWKLAMDLCEMIYSITNEFPPEEKYGLVSQLRRASVSVPSNIAEGAARNSKLEFRHFLGIALGSLSELGTQIEISFRLKSIDFEKNSLLSGQILKCKALTFGLLKYINKDGI